MPREIWDGKGEADGRVTYQLMSGALVGRKYIETVARRELSRLGTLVKPEERRAILAATVGNDRWMEIRADMLARAVARDVVTAYVQGERLPL